MRLTRYVRDQLSLARFTRRNARVRQAFQDASTELPGANAFARLHVMSLALSSVRVSEVPASLNLILPELRPNGIFAGIRTAIEVGTAIAKRLDIPLRLVPLGNTPRGKARAQIVAYVAEEFAFENDILVAAVDELIGLEVSADDLWVATHWTTAHSIDVACRLGVLERDRVIYLVQDYEPGFDPWGVSFALARTTYSAGFRLLVNSLPLHRYLSETENLDIPADHVFAPSLDLVRLREAARGRAKRRRAGEVTVFFYARPSKPRNLFDIGVAALCLAAEELEGAEVAVTFVSAGEQHPDIALTQVSVLRARGKLPWDQYFDALSSVDVVLSLQHSPHPSHPPLDAVTSGAFAVTNEMGGTRRELHPRLLVSEPDPRQLADQIVNAVKRSASNDVNSYDESLVDLLGGSMENAVTAVLNDISAPGRHS